jgi:hypothetical protein
MIAAGVLLLAGCSGEDVAGGADLARAACEYPVPSTPAFDPDQADLALLVELDQVARARSDLVAEAADLDDRWQPLSDAATALAAFAARVREIRSDGGTVADVTTAAMWEQVKYASDAFILECRPVVGG